MMECDCGFPTFYADAPSYEEWLEMLDGDLSYADHDDVLRTYDRDGNRIPYTQWIWIRGVANWYKIIRHDHLQADVLVSTVWIGYDSALFGCYDSALFGHGGPIIFETMVFGVPAWDGWQDRYSTEAQAIEGHERVLAAVRQRVRP